MVAFEERHRARKAESNDDTQGHCVGLRADRYRDHAQGQARHAAGATAPRSGAHHHPSATAQGRSGAALTTTDWANIRQAAGVVRSKD